MATLTKSKTTISIKVDKDLKKQVDQFSDAIGIPVSTMVNAYFRYILATKRFQIDYNGLLGRGQKWNLTSTDISKSIELANKINNTKI